ncbi:MAG: VWA domain-containing protein [Planctomycetes bacterium]|nr:VWA domain-containing protein [Planctomycetota bacterium]
MIASGPGFAFAAPAFLWLLPGLLLVGAWRVRRAATLPVAAAVPWSGLPRTWRTRLHRLPAGLEGAALACLLLALLQPVEVRPAPPLPPGRDLMVCLDCSSSMAVDDLAPGTTRFDVARRLAAEFVLGRSHDRAGLVAFARYCDLRCPLTADRAALAAILASLPLTRRDGPEDATAIGAAVGTAVQALLRTDRASRVVVLVTDGEENVALPGAAAEIAPAHAAQLCKQHGIRVHAIVVGAGNRKADGRVEAIDTSAVRQLAAATGGRFFPAGDAEALARVYAAIDALETEPAQSRGTVTTEWFPACVAAALLLLGVARCLAASWLRRLP